RRLRHRHAVGCGAGGPSPRCARRVDGSYGRSGTLGSVTVTAGRAGALPTAPATASVVAATASVAVPTTSVAPETPVCTAPAAASVAACVVSLAVCVVSGTACVASGTVAGEAPPAVPTPPVFA